jgi:hypothetical protein
MAKRKRTKTKTMIPLLKMIYFTVDHVLIMRLGRASCKDLIDDYPASDPRWAESRQGRYIIYDYLVSDPRWAESRQSRYIIYDSLP